jgi:hypothetical protein
MADLAAVLADPNFVNANPATKQAIFDKWAPQDPNFSNANPATQQAIMQKFGLGAPAAPAMSMSLQPSMPAESTGIPIERKPPTTYEKVREFVTPTVEMLGAAGGGLIGAGAGTLVAPGVGTATGAVGGAGLGYGMAKEALNLADIYIGGKAPRQGAAQVTEPVRNVLEGATFETGGRLLGPALGYLGGKIADLRQIPKQKAADIARNALGPDLPEVLNALKASQGQGVSAAQATAGINSPTWQALIDRATARDPRFLRALEQSQGDVSVNALAKLAGGTTAAEARGTIEQAKANLNAMTGPQREAVLNRANLGKDVADFEARAGKLSAEAAGEVQKVRDLISAGNAAEAWARLDLIKRGLPVGLTKYTYGSELAEKAFNEWSNKAAQASLDLGQGARFAQGAADALRSVGIKPLESAPLIRSISATSNNPAFAGNDLISGAVKNVADDIAKWTGQGGIIDANALEAIRKNSVNAAIAQLRPGADATAQRNLAAGVLSKIKPAIDDAIEAAGGAGWRDYLNTHAKGMTAINEKKLAGKALDLWKNDKDAFVKLVQNETPDVVEKILGTGKYNIATELADSTMTVLQDQAKKRLTEIAVKEQVGAGQEALKQLLLDNMSKLRVPSYLSAVAATTNKALQILENKIGTKTMSTLTEGLKTPEGAVKLLETLPASERNRVLQLISDPSVLTQGSRIFASPGKMPMGTNAKQAAEAIRTGTVTTGVNAMAPERNNENALNQPVRRIDLTGMANR